MQSLSRLNTAMPETTGYVTTLQQFNLGPRHSLCNCMHHAAKSTMARPRNAHYVMPKSNQILHRTRFKEERAILRALPRNHGLP